MENLWPLLEALGVLFSNPELLLQALTHDSFANEHPGVIGNERLELLGDSALSLSITELLFERFPDQPASELRGRMQHIVSKAALAKVAGQFQLEQYIRYGGGTIEDAGVGYNRSVADAMEAVVGAVYVDQGYSAVKSAVGSWFDKLLRDPTLPDEADPKSRLQTICQERAMSVPRYRHIPRGNGVPSGSTCYAVEIHSGGQWLGTGNGSSYQAAEEAAARDALLQMGLL